MSLDDPEEAARAVLEGSPRAAARLISWAEDRDERAEAAMEVLYPETGQAQVYGITGPPGSGKSTLVDKLVDHHREEDRTVGVIAVDPSSPFTGGAVLADRIRMGKRSTDPEVFVRSMGSRGQLGGLAPAVHDAIRILEALGKDIVLVETMGVGQGEVDIVRTADSVTLVAVPGLGDDIQTIKAGIMEIADVFCVNKADLDGVDRTVAELESHLQLAFESDPEPDEWRPPIVKTTAETGEGVDELASAYEDHRDHLETTSEIDERRRTRTEHELLSLMKERVVERVVGDRSDGRFDKIVDAVVQRERTPRDAVGELLEG